MNKKHRMLSGPLAYLLPLLFRAHFFLPPDEGGGGGDEPKPSPHIAVLFGLADDQPADSPPEKKDDDKAPEAGLSLQAAIAQSTDDAAKKKADEEKAAAEKLAADEKAAAEKKAEKAAAAADEAARAQDPGVKVTKRKTDAEIAAEKKAADEKAAAEKLAADRTDWEKGLIEEERDQLELARVAEKKDPTKYKGYAQRMEKFIRENATRVEATDFDPEDEDYKAWVEKELPKFSPTEIRMLERERGAELARAEVDKKTQEAIDSAFRLVTTPQVKAEADAYYAQAVTQVMPEEVAKAFKESPEKAREAFPFEYEIIEREMDAHATVVEEMLALPRKNPETGRNLKAYDENSPAHRAALTLLHEVDAAFKKAGADLVRGGKQFLTRAELARVPQPERAKFWTFTPREIAQRSTDLVKGRIADKIKAEQARMEKLGFQRKTATAPAAPAAPAASAPAPRPAAIGGNGGAVTETAGTKLMRESGMIPSA